MKYTGDLIIKEGDNTNYSQLTEVTGDLSIFSDAKLEANNLTSVGGGLSIHSNAKLEANNLTSVGGCLYINSDAKLEAQFLKGLSYKSVDGYLFVIESTKSKGNITIYKGYNAKSVKDNLIARHDCYVAESGEFYAHGASLKKAVEDLQFKIISEKLKHEPINKDTIIDIKYYRLVTGACELGVKSFIEANELKDSYKACELLPILENKHAYGIEKFKSLLTF